MYNNNYGYNPYGRYMQQPMEQPMTPAQMPATQRTFLNGKQVDSIEMARVSDIPPMDGTVMYFPVVDGSAIVTKQIQLDGTSKLVIYKPVTEKEDTIKYLTADDLIDLEDEIKELRQEIKEIRKKKKDD